jgi:hypothetical protein
MQYSYASLGVEIQQGAYWQLGVDELRDTELAVGGDVEFFAQDTLYQEAITASSLSNSEIRRRRGFYHSYACLELAIASI